MRTGLVADGRKWRDDESAPVKSSSNSRPENAQLRQFGGLPMQLPAEAMVCCNARRIGLRMSSVQVQSTEQQTPAEQANGRRKGAPQAHRQIVTPEVVEKGVDLDHYRSGFCIA